MRSSKSRSRSKPNRPRTLGNIVNRVFDSSGPEGKVRGTPQQIIEKYQMLAGDAQRSNDRVAAENFSQHAEHYTRMLAEAMREMAAEQEQRLAQQGQQNQGRDGQNRDGQNRDGQNRDGQNRDGQNRDRSQDNRGDHRPDNRPDNRNDNRPDNRNDNRPDNRHDSDDQPRPAAFDVIEAEESQLVDLPETNNQRRHAEPKLRFVEESDSFASPAALAAQVEAQSAAPRKPRAPRVKKPVAE